MHYTQGRYLPGSMTRENLESLRRIYEGWAAGDLFAEASLYDPSGVRVEDHAFQVWTFRGGKVIRLEIFEDEAVAFEAVGLRE